MPLVSYPLWKCSLEHQSLRNSVTLPPASYHVGRFLVNFMPRDANWHDFTSSIFFMLRGGEMQDFMSQATSKEEFLALEE